MDPVHDVLYRVHQFQAQRRGQAPLARADFGARLPATCETDLTGLLLPPAGATVRNQVRGEPKVQLGQFCLTPQALEAVPAPEVLRAIARHAAGDWGALDQHDRQENERALRNRGRLFSAYETSSGTRFWVITDPGWAVTTLLLPEDD